MFVITEIRTVGEDLRVAFSSAIGQSYRLKRSADLGLGSWGNVTEVTATGLTKRVTDAGGAGLPRRFYRLAENRAGNP